MWKDIPEHEGLYKISDAGQVYSCPKWKKKVYKSSEEVWHYYQGKHMKPRTKHHGYKYVTLCKDGVYNNHHIHRLVLRTFVGEPEDGQVACHNDGDTANNELDNLRWDTVSNNHADKIKHGTHNRGERCGTAKLTQVEVIEIKCLEQSGKFSQADLSKMFGCCQSNINAIIRGKTWSY